MRLGDVAPGFRQRAFEHTLSHLQHGEFQARDALAQLEDVFREVLTVLSQLCMDTEIRFRNGEEP